MTYVWLYGAAAFGFAVGYVVRSLTAMQRPIFVPEHNCELEAWWRRCEEARKR